MQNPNRELLHRFKFLLLNRLFLLLPRSSSLWLVEKPVIQEFVPPALNKFRQKNPKERLKARVLTAAELAEQTALARNTRKRRRGGVEVEEETQMTQEVIAVRSC